MEENTSPAEIRSLCITLQWRGRIYRGTTRGNMVETKTLHWWPMSEQFYYLSRTAACLTLRRPGRLGGVRMRRASRERTRTMC